MSTWLNHVAIAAPRNGTTDHTVTPSSGSVVAGSLFTPTVGRVLLVFVDGAVTSTTPSGWTLPTNGSAIGNTGLYVWYRTAVGADTLTTTHNGSNYPVIFDFYEFTPGSTFLGSISAIGVSASGGAGPTLTGLTGTHWDAGVSGQANATGSSNSYTWDLGVETTDTSVVASPTDGYTFGVTAIVDSVVANTAFAATSTNTTDTLERLVVAVNIAAAGPDPVIMLRPLVIVP